MEIPEQNMADRRVGVTQEMTKNFILFIIFEHSILY